MNILIKYLQMLTEVRFLDWVPSKGRKEFNIIFSNFIITVSEKRNGGEENPRWVLETNDVNGGLKELIGYHDKNNGYPDVCRLFHTIEAMPAPNEDTSYSQNVSSELQKRAIIALSKELLENFSK